MFTFNKQGITQDLLLLLKGHYKMHNGTILDAVKKLFSVLFFLSPEDWKDYSMQNVFKIVSRSFRECVQVEPRLMDDFFDRIERDYWWESDGKLSIEKLILNMLSRMTDLRISEDGVTIADMGEVNPEVQEKLTLLDEERKVGD